MYHCSTRIALAEKKRGPRVRETSGGSARRFPFRQVRIQRAANLANVRQARGWGAVIPGTNAPLGGVTHSRSGCVRGAKCLSCVERSAWGGTFGIGPQSWTDMPIRVRFGGGGRRASGVMVRPLSRGGARPWGHDVADADTYLSIYPIRGCWWAATTSGVYHQEDRDAEDP